MAWDPPRSHVRPYETQKGCVYKVVQLASLVLRSQGHSRDGHRIPGHLPEPPNPRHQTQPVVPGGGSPLCALLPLSRDSSLSSPRHITSGETGKTCFLLFFTGGARSEAQTPPTLPHTAKQTWKACLRIRFAPITLAVWPPPPGPVSVQAALKHEPARS